MVRNASFDNAETVNGEQLLDPIGCAEFIGVTTKTLAAWRCSGRYNLPFVRVGRVIRYRMKDILRWLDERTEAGV